MRLLGVVGGVLAWILAYAGTATAADPARPRSVLLLYAETRLAPALTLVDAAFRSTVSAQLGAPADFRTEFLDLPPTQTWPTSNA